jgi:hypothetical protein
MSPVDIADSAEFRAGLARHLAEVGLIPPENVEPRVVPVASAPAARGDEDRKAA